MEPVADHSLVPSSTSRLDRRDERRGSLVRPTVIAAGSIALVAASWTPAAAETSKPEEIRLHFDVERDLANQCPKQERFLELLRAEHPQVTLAPEGTSARTFDVQIRRRPGGGFSGEVIVTGVEGSSNTRHVTATDCAALTGALAVVAAIASDVVRAAEEASLQSRPAPTAETPYDASPTAEEVPAGGPTKKPARADRTGTRHGAVDRKQGAERQRAQHGSRPWGIGAGAGTELVLGPLPRAVMGYRAYVETQRALDRFAAGARLSFAFAQAPLPGTTRIDIRVQTWTARLEACASYGARLPASVETCAAATTGAFDSFDTALAGGHQTYPWLALGAGARVRWYVGLGVHAELFGNMSYAATVYDTVARDQSGAADHVSRAVGEVGLGAGYSFRGL